MSLERLTTRAKEVLSAALESEKPTYKLLLKEIERVDGLGKHLIDLVPPTGVKKTQTVALEDLIKESFYQAIKMHHVYVGTEHFYLALLSLSASKQLDRARFELYRLDVFPKVTNYGDDDKNTPIISTFGYNLNNRMLRGTYGTIVEREEYEKLVSTLLLRDNYNALLVGEPGVGKHTLVKLLAHNINTMEVPPVLAGHTLIVLNMLSFMTSTVNKGGIDLGIAALVDELKNIKNSVLVLDNFQDIFFSSPAGLTIPIFFSILRSYLDEAGIGMITFLTPSMYEKIIAENEHIIENFSVVEVSEPDEETTKEILKVNSVRMEDYHNVTISDEVLDYIYERAALDFKEDKFPQKAVELLDNSCAYLIVRKSKVPKSYKDLVNKNMELGDQIEEKLRKRDYSAALRARTKIKSIQKQMSSKEQSIFMDAKVLTLETKDVDKVLEDLGLVLDYSPTGSDISKFSVLNKKLKKKIIGQDAAVEVLSKALIRSKLGLRAKKRPLGNFLFLGPTGVGKTELAKAVAEAGFKSDLWGGLIRLDMSDFSEKHNVARLVGAPPGYVGYGEGGELTTKIGNYPSSVVLFDEIEKAHPEVLNILLQIMEEGELSDARGNTYDFSKAVIILTSNLGTEILHKPGIGFDSEEVKDDSVEARLKSNLKKILKPELINRFDEVVVFKRLTKSDQGKILTLLLKEVKETLKKQDVTLKVTTTARNYLLEKGFSKEYGARALRRTVEKELLDKVAQVLLEKQERPLELEAIAKDQELVVS